MVVHKRLLIQPCTYHKLECVFHCLLLLFLTQVLNFIWIWIWMRLKSQSSNDREWEWEWNYRNGREWDAKSYSRTSLVVNVKLWNTKCTVELYSSRRPLLRNHRAQLSAFVDTSLRSVNSMALSFDLLSFWHIEFRWGNIPTKFGNRMLLVLQSQRI